MQPIQLPSRCDRAATQAIHPEVLEADNDTALRVDAGQVEHIGHAMLQLLVSAARSSSGLELINPSKTFRKTVAMAKLETVLGVGETE